MTSTERCDQSPSPSTLHQIHVLNRDRAAVAVIGDENGKPDRGFRRRHGEHDQCIDLADNVAEEGGESDEIDIHRKQNELDRHQNDDDVLAVEEDAENPEREQDRGDGKVVAEPDDHDSPCPDFTLTTSIAVDRRRATCWAMDWRLTPGLWCSVITMAPIMATSRIMPADSKK